MGRMFNMNKALILTIETTVFLPPAILEAILYVLEHYAM